MDLETRIESLKIEIDFLKDKIHNDIDFCENELIGLVKTDSKNIGAFINNIKTSFRNNPIFTLKNKLSHDCVGEFRLKKILT